MRVRLAGADQCVGCLEFTDGLGCGVPVGTPLGRLVSAPTGSVELARTAVSQLQQAWVEGWVHVRFHGEPARPSAHHPFAVAR
jgi:hypothetical protein